MKVREIELVLDKVELHRSLADRVEVKVSSSGFGRRLPLKISFTA